MWFLRRRDAPSRHRLKWTSGLVDKHPLSLRFFCTEQPRLCASTKICWLRLARTFVKEYCNAKSTMILLPYPYFCGSIALYPANPVAYVHHNEVFSRPAHWLKMRGYLRDLSVTGIRVLVICRRLYGHPPLEILHGTR